LWVAHETAVDRYVRLTSSTSVYVGSPAKLSSWLTNVSVTECPACEERFAVTWVHAALVEQTLGRSVVVVPVAPSRRITVNQSNITVSGQVMRYQNESVPPPVGTVNVWASVLVFEGDVEPTLAANFPLCAVFTIAVTPVRLHPVKSPVSNPPFTITGVTVSATVVV
jgi:hypothetical protein